MEWTGARYADKPTVESGVHIAASPEEVWAMVADPELMPSLSEEVYAVEWLDGVTSASLGARFVGRSRHPALGEWSTTCYIVEFEPNRVFAWAVEDATYPTATWRFTLKPDWSGTHLTQWVQMGPARSGLSLAIDRMPEKEQKIVFVRLREFEQGIERNLRLIKERLEQSPAATGSPRPSA